MIRETKITGQEAFIRMAGDPDVVKRTIKQSQAAFPQDRWQQSCHFAWKLLYLSGIETALGSHRGGFAQNLGQRGWKAVNVKSPGCLKAGDIAMTEEGYVSVVAKVDTAGNFWHAVDVGCEEGKAVRHEGVGRYLFLRPGGGG
jgi:hypothetical protein